MNRYLALIALLGFSALAVISRPARALESDSASAYFQITGKVISFDHVRVKLEDAGYYRDVPRSSIRGDLRPGQHVTAKVMLTGLQVDSAADDGYPVEILGPQSPGRAGLLRDSRKSR